jgi:hypothetical protein
MWWEHIGNKGKMKISFSPTPTLKEIKNRGTLTTCRAFLLGKSSFFFLIIGKPACLSTKTKLFRSNIYFQSFVTRLLPPLINMGCLFGRKEN